MVKTTTSMIEHDLTTNKRGRVTWASECQECGSPTNARAEALFVRECPVCNLPGCNLCMPRGNRTPCNECLMLLKEDPEYG